MWPHFFPFILRQWTHHIFRSLVLQILNAVKTQLWSIRPVTDGIKLTMQILLTHVLVNVKKQCLHNLSRILTHMLLDECVVLEVVKAHFFEPLAVQPVVIVGSSIQLSDFDDSFWLRLSYELLLLLILLQQT